MKEHAQRNMLGVHPAFPKVRDFKHTLHLGLALGVQLEIAHFGE
jgi:hypothetical protein